MYQGRASYNPGPPCSLRCVRKYAPAGPAGKSGTFLKIVVVSYIAIIAIVAIHKRSHPFRALRWGTNANKKPSRSSILEDEGGNVACRGATTIRPYMQQH